MTLNSRQIAKLAARGLITALLLIWVFSQIDLGQFWRAATAARWPYLIGVWAMTVVFFWIRSVSLQLILKQQGCVVNLATIFGASAVTSLYGMVLPEIVGTGVKWYILKKNTGKGTNVLSSMLYGQLSLLVTMTVFGLVALMIANPVSVMVSGTHDQWLVPVVCGVCLICVVTISILLLNARTGGAVFKVLVLSTKPLPPQLRQKVEQILGQIALFQSAGARFHLTIALINAGACVVGCIFIYALSAGAANIAVSLGTLTWLCAAVYLLGRLPISVANLGVREVTLVGLLSIYGVDKTAALLMSMILFSSLVFMAAIGAVFQVLWAISSRKSRHNADPERRQI